MATHREDTERSCLAKSTSGEVVEHEAGYRSEFAKIVSLDYGDPELLKKFRRIYGLDDAKNE
jgi:hypothetical protein